jgi:UDP-N-acetylmuramoyl-tripeptide--D-alanyl-D-alanine ligase
MNDAHPIPWNAEDIIRATGGDPLTGGGTITFTGVSIDSRSVSEKDFFVAVKGERHDGHYFIPDVISKGVKGFLISREMRMHLPVDEWISKGIWIVAVENTVAALGALAGFQRRRAGIPVAAITGSNGNTTTKHLPAAVVGRKFNTLHTVGNLNNEIGLPLTLLKLSRAHQAAVVEMGMNHPGEITRLSAIAQPDIGVITTIGPAHLEGLGTVEDVMAAKGEIRKHMKEDGCLVLNGDNPYCLRLGASTRQKVIYFGTSEQAHVRAVDVQKSGYGSSFTMVLPQDKIRVNLGLPGRFMVNNALAAGTVGHLLGISTKEIQAGIESVKPAKGRMAVLETKRGVRIIDDTYNANPGSMEAALRTLIFLKEKNRGILVAGDMLELGEQSAELHAQIGRLAAELGVDGLFLTGREVASVARGAHMAGMPAGDIVTGDKIEIAEKLSRDLRPSDWVLVKGSRSMGMEEIVEYLMNRME